MMLVFLLLGSTSDKDLTIFLYGTHKYVFFLTNISLILLSSCIFFHLSHQLILNEAKQRK